jgi:hypothetical protein
MNYGSVFGMQDKLWKVLFAILRTYEVGNNILVSHIIEVGLKW